MAAIGTAWADGAWIKESWFADATESAWAGGQVVAAIVRRGGVRWLREPDPEIREEKVEELVSLVKPKIKPKSGSRPPQKGQDLLLTAVQDATARMAPPQQRRLDRLLQQTGVSLEELLIILS